MRGGKRPGSGRKPKALADLQLTGGFRPARHAHLLKPAFPVASPLPAAVLDGLQARGRAFVESLWPEYTEWTLVSQVVLREAGLLVDQLEALRGTKGERAAQRMLLSVLAALDLKG